MTTSRSNKAKGDVFNASTGKLIADMNQGKTVETNIKLHGTLSEVNREVDVALEESDYEFIAIECKNWKKPIDVPVVEAFATKLKDIGATKGAIVSNSPFSKAAKNMASKLKIDLLHAVDTHDPNIKGKLYAPVLTIDRQISRYYIQLHADPLIDLDIGSNFEGLIMVEERYRVVDFLKKLWNEDKLQGDKPGAYAATFYNVLLQDKRKTKFIGNLRYNYLVELVYKEAQLQIVKARGLYDVKNNVFRVAAGELLFDTIRVEDINKNWKRISEEEAKANKYVIQMQMVSKPKNPRRVPANSI